MGLGRVAYRAPQFLGSLRARVSAEERAVVAGVLTPSEQRLFESMTVRDQRHGLDVYDAWPLKRAVRPRSCGSSDFRRRMERETGG